MNSTRVARLPFRHTRVELRILLAQPLADLSAKDALLQTNLRHTMALHEDWVVHMDDDARCIGLFGRLSRGAAVVFGSPEAGRREGSLINRRLRCRGLRRRGNAYGRALYVFWFRCANLEVFVQLAALPAPDWSRVALPAGLLVVVLCASFQVQQS